MKIFIISVLISLFVFYATVHCDCRFSMEDLEEKHPLLLYPNTTKSFYPTNDDQTDLILRKHQALELSCPGSKLQHIDEENVIAICKRNTIFTINNRDYSINNIECSKKPNDIARLTGDTCYDDIQEIEVGFEITNRRFKKVLTICFDNSKKNPVYSKHTISKFISTAETNVARPNFVVDNFYVRGIKLDELYDVHKQQAAVNVQLGLPLMSRYYIGSQNFLLERGHLAPKADFIDGAEQAATFHYVNTAPQWKSINHGNWYSVENKIRNYAEDQNLNLDIYSGTHGILTLPHNSTGAPVELYLAYSRNAKSIPIPKLFWKIVHSTTLRRAVVVLSINNPHFINKDKDVICKDILNNVQWLTLNRNSGGYIYACDYNDFKEVVRGIPRLNVKGILY